MDGLSVPRRNGQAVEQALRRMASEILFLTERVDRMNAAVATLSTRVAAVEQAEAARRAASMGHGPTER